MMRGSRQSIRAVLTMIVVAGLVPLAVLAQDPGIEADVGQSMSGIATGAARAQAAAEPPATTDTQTLATFYHRRGRARSQLGDYSGALADLRLALANNPTRIATPDNWGFRWRIQDDLDHVLSLMGDLLGRLAFVSEVAREYVQGQGAMDIYNYHVSNLKLVQINSDLGNYPQARAALKVADETLSRLRSTRQWPTNGVNSTGLQQRYAAILHQREGNLAEAERLFRLALANAENNLAFQRGRLPAGHQFIRVAFVNVGNIRSELASVLATRGRYGEAELHARTGLDERLAVSGFGTTPVSYSLGTIAWSRYQQGDLAGAEKLYRHALTALEQSGALPHSTAYSLQRSMLANVLVAQSRWHEALQVFEERAAGLRSDAAQSGLIRGGHVSWAYALHRSGQSGRAVKMTGTMIAVQSKRPVVNQWHLAQLRGVLAMALASEGRTADALKSFRESVPELVRRDQDVAATEDAGYWRVFWQRTILEAYLELLSGLHASGVVHPDIDWVDESFRIADIARGSEVQEAITATAARAQVPDKALAELARREQDALNRMVALNHILARLASVPQQDRLDQVIADMRAEIERLRKEHAALRADLRARFPGYAELIDPRPASLADVRKALAPGESLVSIYVGETRSYVWTIGSGARAAFRVVPWKRDEIERDVRELRRALDLEDSGPGRLRAFDLARAHRLYHAFFEPDEALWKDAQVLKIVPHGALAQLPAGLLVTAAPTNPAEASYRDVPWLIRKVAIAQVPSANALIALRRAPVSAPRRQPFIGFGDPVFSAGSISGAPAVVRSLQVRKAADATQARIESAIRGGRSGLQTISWAAPGLSGAFALLSALPDTSEELKDIALALKADPARDVFVNRQATEQNLKRIGLDGRRVVAFATHGIAPGELTGLDQPALVLSNPAIVGDADNDGFLTMEEVLGLKLDADWVVLSACNTASADGRGAEAVSGLGRAFFYAGARSLLVSNWAVETTSARRLTTELFRRQAENAQLTRAEALRESMLDLMGKSGPGGLSYAHPAFWAPFSLVGDGGR